MNDVPVATVGELLMWNITVPGLDLENEPPDWVVTVPAGVAAKMAVRILEQWGLSASAALGVSPSTVRRYRQRGVPRRLSTLERVEGVLRMHTHLRVLFARDQEQVARWLHRPMPAFNGRAPADVIYEEGPAPVVRFTQGAMQW